MNTLLIVIITVIATILALAFAGRFVVWKKNNKKPRKTGPNSKLNNGENIVIALSEEE